MKQFPAGYRLITLFFRHLLNIVTDVSFGKYRWLARDCYEIKFITTKIDSKSLFVSVYSTD